MYESAPEAIKQILAIVDGCPEPFRSSCFEVLLRGYVESELRSMAPAPTPLTPAIPPAAGGPQVRQIPQPLLLRFQTFAKRLQVPLDKLEALFDFTSDPFTYHAFSVTGANRSEKSRNLALLLAARSYLATGSWSADWQEVKAACVDQNCYDVDNHAANLKKSGKQFFKSVTPGKPLELSTEGIQTAERLVAALVG